MSTPPRIAVAHRATGRVTELSPFLLADGSGPPRWQTRVAIEWNESGLFILFACDDDDAWGTLVDRDAPLWQEEAVELFLASGDETPNSYFEFEVSPLGALFDARVDNPHGDRIGMWVDVAWNCSGIRWSAAPTGERQNWRAELFVPWSGLGLEAPPPLLRANFYRIERPRDGAPEFSCWSPTLTSPADFHRPARFGVLELIG